MGGGGVTRAARGVARRRLGGRAAAGLSYCSPVPRAPAAAGLEAVMNPITRDAPNARTRAQVSWQPPAGGPAPDQYLVSVADDATSRSLGASYVTSAPEFGLTGLPCLKPLKVIVQVGGDAWIGKASGAARACPQGPRRTRAWAPSRQRHALKPQAHRAPPPSPRRLLHRRGPHLRPAPWGAAAVTQQHTHRPHAPALHRPPPCPPVHRRGPDLWPAPNRRHRAAAAAAAGRGRRAAAARGYQQLLPGADALPLAGRGAVCRPLCVLVSRRARAFDEDCAVARGPAAVGRCGPQCVVCSCL